MSGQHKKPTISFRVSDSERAQIEANIKASGMSKQNYFVKSAIYNRVCVVGKKETIYPLVEELKSMQEQLSKLAYEFAINEVTATAEDVKSLEEEYIAMLTAIIKMLDGAEYLWHPKKIKS